MCPSRKNPMRCAGIYAKILFSRSLTFFKPIVPTICSRQSSTRNGPKNWWTLSPLTSLVPSYKYVAFYPMKIPPTQSLKVATKWLISHSEFWNCNKCECAPGKFLLLGNGYTMLMNLIMCLIVEFWYSTILVLSTVRGHLRLCRGAVLLSIDRAHSSEPPIIAGS